MKSIKIIIAVLLLSASGIFAQVPNAINFQAIARDANGDVMSSTDIMIRLTVINGSVNGQEIYQELRALTTNEYGSFAFQIGQDADYVTIGTFEDIQWNIGNKFLKIDYDPTNQFDWSLTLGTIEFGTVPYAFTAGAVSYIDLSGVQSGDVLLYNAATGMFEPGQISGGTVEWSNIINAPEIPNTISDLTDVNTTGVSNGQVLRYNGLEWVNDDPLWNLGNSNQIFTTNEKVNIGIENPSSQYYMMLNLKGHDTPNDTIFDMIGYYLPGSVIPKWHTSIVGDNFTFAETGQFGYRLYLQSGGNVGIGTNTPTSKLQVIGLPEYADNAAALAGGLTVGAFYRTGDILKVVH